MCFFPRFFPGKPPGLLQEGQGLEEQQEGRDYFSRTERVSFTLCDEEEPTSAHCQYTRSSRLSFSLSTRLLLFSFLLLSRSALTLASLRDVQSEAWQKPQCLLYAWEPSREVEREQEVSSSALTPPPNSGAEREEKKSIDVRILTKGRQKKKLRALLRGCRVRRSLIRCKALVSSL